MAFPLSGSFWPKTRPSAADQARNTAISDEEVRQRPYKAFYLPFKSGTALIDQRHPTAPHPILARPVFAPLVFTNEQSDVRDHCANERTFLSWLRLSTYLAICSVAIIINFHLKNKPTAAEKRAALPLGAIFWLLSLGCLGSGLANYVRTVESYGRRAALVQTGWKTQLIFTVVATAIIAACVFFLSIDANGNRK